MCLKDIILQSLNKSILNSIFTHKEGIIETINQRQIIIANDILYSDEDILSVVYDDVLLTYKIRWKKVGNGYHLEKIELL